MERNKKKEEWTSQEIQLLNDLHSQFSSKKWKRISEVFRGHGYLRSEIECREKWINFLDPSVKKTQWEDQELRRLYDLHSQVGTRWCIIQKELNRTQNKIKNRFYGTIRNYIRFVLGYFDSVRTCYNFEISKLSPKFLNDLYTSQNAFDFMAGQAKEAIYSMNFAVDKKIMAERTRERRPLYSRMHQIIFGAFQGIESASPVRREPLNIVNQDFPDESPPQQIPIKKEESTDGVIIEARDVLRSINPVNPPQTMAMGPWLQHQSFSYPFIYWFA